MFGAVPKTIWNKTNPADQNNLIDISARCLLIEDGKRLVLIDSGMGNKQSEKFFSYYSLWGDDTLERSINNAGFSLEDVTDVFFTHLHFDHCGGAIKRSGAGFEPVFKNAAYWTNKKHWNWAINPNKREVASFLKENLLPIEETGRLRFLSELDGPFSYTNELGFEVFYADGHTEKQMLPIISYNGQKIAFAGDLIPTAGHIPVPYLMGYDVRPLVTMEEKSKILKNCLENETLLFLQHDPYNELVSLMDTDKGVRLENSSSLNDFFS